MIRFFTLFFAFTLVFVCNSQEDSIKACALPEKKIQKIINKANEIPVASEKVQLFLEAIEKSPTTVGPYLAFGAYAFDDAMLMYQKGTPNAIKSADRSLVKAEEMLLKGYRICTKYHADLSYYLGVIYYYQKKNIESLKFFKEFQNFESKEVARYSKDHDKRLVDVNDIVVELEEEAALFNNPVPFNPKVVQNVSSSFDEYFPMISPDNELMFFTRKYLKTLPNNAQKYVEDYTFSHRASVNELFDTGIAFDKPFNDGYFDSYGSSAMSVDNKEMILCACKDIFTHGQKYRNCDLYVTRFERTGKGGNDFKWTPLENLGSNINSDDGWEAQPTLSPDGNMLIYAVNGAETQDNDLYVSYRDADGKWGPSTPIVELNTEGKDKSPFLHQDSETLYFVSSCSDTRKGVGGTDIFYSRKEGDKWSKPKNLGFPINTKEDEIGLFVSTDGKLAYYSSKQGENWDIFSFDLYREARPHAVALVKGELKDNLGNPVSDATIEVAYGTSGKTEKIKINGHDGKYAAIVKVEEAQDIVVTVKKEGHSFDSKLITKEEVQKVKEFVKGNDTLYAFKKREEHEINSLKHNKDLVIQSHKSSIEQPKESSSDAQIVKEKEVQIENDFIDGKPLNSLVIGNTNLSVTPIEVGMTYTINDILFASNSFDLNDKSKFIITQFSKFLLENKGMEIVIQGHTDNVGDAKKNELLSQQRAEAVMNYLIQLGISSSRMNSIGYGALHPKVPNTTDQNKAINRRTEFKIEKIQ